MKITIYELLGLIKDGKAPKKIKYEYSIYELMPERNVYYCKNEMRWFTNEINSLGVLNNEVEIIEGPKKIEKCKNYEGLTFEEKVLLKINYYLSLPVSEIVKSALLNLKWVLEIYQEEKVKGRSR
jgi:hypothetical protein